VATSRWLGTSKRAVERTLDPVAVRGWVSPTNLGDQLVVPTAPIRLFGSPDC
jgi:hypothetical protein